VDGLTQAQWDAIVQQLGPVKANAWLAKRNQELAAELPPTNPTQPPVYPNQPLAAAQPQGVSKVDETEDTTPAGALPGSDDAIDFANLTPETYSRLLGETQSQIAKLAPVMGEKDYEAAKQKIMERRFGPSRAEQLFALSAALAKPTYAGNRFGQILGNVAPALGEAERQRREADAARETALEQLKQQYLTGQNANTRAQLEGRLGLLRAAGTMMKPQNPWSGSVYDPVKGRWMQQPGKPGGPPTLTAQEVAALSADPKNKGMPFFTTDGRPMTIK